MRRLTIALAIGLFASACGGGVLGAEGTASDEGDVPKATTTTRAETGSATDVQATATTRGESVGEPEDEISSTAASGVTTSATSTTRPEPTTTTTGGGDDMVATGQVPDELMSQVFAHAEDVSGVDRSAMTVTRAEAVTWQDGSLGCPQPGMSYTQALVDGYWVELIADGETLDYRLSDSGGMVLCENGGADPLPRGDT